MMIHMQNSLNNLRMAKKEFLNKKKKFLSLKEN